VTPRAQSASIGGGGGRGEGGGDGGNGGIEGGRSAGLGVKKATSTLLTP
jgi:hypothetical protein